MSFILLVNVVRVGEKKQKEQFGGQNKKQLELQKKKKKRNMKYFLLRLMCLADLQLRTAEKIRQMKFEENVCSKVFLSN